MLLDAWQHQGFSNTSKRITIDNENILLSATKYRCSLRKQLNPVSRIVGEDHISTIKLTETKLSNEERAKLRVLTISIDPERDTPEVLRETMLRHSVDADRWTMTRPEPGDLRAIAGVFGIKYKKLPDGEFNHSTRIVLLDSEGTPVASTERLGRHDPVFLEAIKTSLQ